MRYNPEQTAYLATFTYFKDTDGFIYYASGDNSLDNDAIRSVLVYTPSEDNSAVRYQPNSETSYAKNVSHGYQSELERLRESLPPEQYRTISAMFERNDENGDEFLAVQSSRVTEVYDPKAALQQLYNHESPAYSVDATEKVRETVKAFEGVGIELNRLGLYGGLQCSLVHTDGKEMLDVDLLVEGISAYDDVVGLSAGNIVHPETFPAFIATHPIKRAVAMRRGQLSQFRLPQHPDTVVDVRIVRAERDDQSVADLLSRLTPQSAITLTGAKVVDAKESLSIPACFKVQDTNGKIWSVITNQYHHLGAATKGDLVSVHGRIGDADTILLTDPVADYIYIPTLL